MSALTVTGLLEPRAFIDYLLRSAHRSARSGVVAEASSSANAGRGWMASRNFRSNARQRTERGNGSVGRFHLQDLGADPADTAR